MSDREHDCGRWDRDAPGGLRNTCRLAGTEWCDWDCPIGRRTVNVGDDLHQILGEALNQLAHISK